MKRPHQSKLIWLAFATTALGAAMEWLREWDDLIPHSPVILMVLGFVIGLLRVLTVAPLTVKKK